MEENKNQRHTDSDQLRPDTTNEVIRNTGNTPNSQQNEGSSDRNDLGTSDDNQRTSTNAADLTSSSNRSGNSEISNSTRTGSGHDTTTRGSDLTTKRSVTGSDFDGQAT